MTEKAVAAPPSILVSLAKDLAMKSEQVEQAEETLKSLKAQETAIEKKLSDEMITQEVKSFKLDGLGGFRTQACMYPNVTDREALMAAVAGNKDWRGLIKESINGNTLKSFIKELSEQGKKLPPGVEPYTQMEIRRFK